MSDLNPARPIPEHRAHFLAARDTKQLLAERAGAADLVTAQARKFVTGEYDVERAKAALADALDDLADVDAEIARRKPMEAGR